MLLVTLAYLTTAANATGAAEPSGSGQTIEVFSAPDIYGETRSLADYADRKAVVVLFLGTECPLVKLYANRLNALAKDYAERGVAVVGINSNRQDSITDITAYVRQHQISFPILKDLNNTIADQFAAERTPEAFVLDQDRVVRYRGRIDDQFGVGVQRQAAAKHNLLAAVDAVLAGQPVAVPQTEAPGCLIGRVSKVAPTGDVTYCNQVSRILQSKCVECHRPNEIAPFALTSFEEVVGWADMICEVIDQNRMPPWFANPKHGKFANDCSLAPEEKLAIATWVENGCPEGDEADLPPPPKFIDGWRIPEPDMVLSMPEEFEVPAEGVVAYQSYILDPQLKEDRWIQAAETRPGNRSVVHHIVVNVRPPGAKGTQLSFGDKLACVFTPGTPPWEFPAGTAIKVPAGSTLLMQLHYTPCGTPQKDRSIVGIKFADPNTVKTTAQSKFALNLMVDIPPGEPNYKMEASYKVKKDIRLVNLFPHMHYRGKSFRFEAEYPDGKREILLDVPHYDFGWQLRYDLVEPKLLPKGSKLHCYGVFDNSADNPRNPDPSVRVGFGEQSWQEMMVGFFTAEGSLEDEAKSSERRQPKQKDKPKDDKLAGAAGGN